ncbi:MAG: hypothetical protein JOZ16_00305, partial [Methylobacteriaceae bacterium]|nr:hypothetical protein [Methylobacteriaceae bacterium]
MRYVHILCLIFGMEFLTLPAVHADTAAVSTESAASERFFLEVEKCVSRGEEIVLLPQGPECQPYKKGGPYLDGMRRSPNADSKSGAMLGDTHRIDPDEVCGSMRDQRVLGRHTIKDIVSRTAGKVDATGIRIIGDIFCDGLDLIGLDLPYSLVLDKLLIRQDV